jgi:hypothetical protein
LLAGELTAGWCYLMLLVNERLLRCRKWSCSLVRILRRNALRLSLYCGSGTVERTWLNGMFSVRTLSVLLLIPRSLIYHRPVPILHSTLSIIRFGISLSIGITSCTSITIFVSNSSKACSTRKHLACSAYLLALC